MGFLHTTDERFIVLSEIMAAAQPGKGRFSLTTFDHENTFLKLVATADLPMDMTTEIIAAVLLSVSQPIFPHRWVEVDLDQPEIGRLGLYEESVEVSHFSDLAPMDVSSETVMKEPVGLLEDAEQFYEFMMQAPTPFVILSGPEHQFTFINPPYVRLMGRLTDEAVLGKTIREALPELEGQPYFGLLDQVYQTGEAYVGIEVPAKLRSDIVGHEQDHFFDFIYHPLRNRGGKVCGLMVQATDVTERVLSRAVTSNREDQLYTQWLELEAIYKTAPVGIMLLDARRLRVLRVNELQARFLGETVAELEGRSLREDGFRTQAFRQLLERALTGEPISNVVVEPESVSEGWPCWQVSITPFLDRSGAVDKLYTVSLEVPVQVGAHTDLAGGADFGLDGTGDPDL